jgi:hypothetical protein
MKAGSKYAEMLARSPPLSDADLITTTKFLRFQIEIRSRRLRASLAIWTRPGILLLACVEVAQFQTSTGVEHYEALKHLIGYLRRNPPDVL